MSKYTVMFVVRDIRDEEKGFKHRLQAIVYGPGGIRYQVDGKWSSYGLPASLQFGDVAYFAVNDNLAASLKSFPNPQGIFEIRQHTGMSRGIDDLTIHEYRVRELTQNDLMKDD